MDSTKGIFLSRYDNVINFKSKEDIDFGKDLLIEFDSNQNSYFMLYNLSVIETERISDIFKYKISSEKIIPLSKWEYNVIKNQ